MADWFVDSAATGSGDGTSTSNAWNTIERPLAGTDGWTSAGSGQSGGPVTTAGDVVWIKDDHAEVWDTNPTAYISCGRPVGSATSPVVFRKDDYSHAWNSTGGTPSVTTANSTLAYIRWNYQAGGSFLIIQDIDFIRPTTNNTSPSYLFYTLDPRSHLRFSNCTFTAYKGLLRIDAATFIEIEDCTFDGTGYTVADGNGIATYDGSIINIKRTTLKKDASYLGANCIVGHLWGFSYFNLEEVVIENWTNAITASNRFVSITGRDVDMSTGVTNEIGSGTWYQGSSVILQDINDNPRLAKHYQEYGTLWTVESVGGRDTILKANPNSRCSEHSPLKLFEFWVPADAADGAVDYSIQAYATSWSTLPTSDNFVFEVGYYNTASSSGRTWEAAGKDFDDADTWETFTVSSITNAEDGFVILRGWLKGYEDGSEEVWVDIVDDGNAVHWFQGWPFREPPGGGGGVSGGLFMLTDDG